MNSVSEDQHKTKLHDLFIAIEKEFDALYEENQECMYFSFHHIFFHLFFLMSVYYMHYNIIFKI